MVRVKNPVAAIKETIIFEGLYRKHLYREFEEVRQFVFECISSLINVLFKFPKRVLYVVLPVFSQGAFLSLTVFLSN